MLEQFPGRVLYKPEAEPVINRLRALLRETDGKAKVFEGSGGRHLRESFQHGVVGTMPGADLAPAVSALWSALQDGDLKRADRTSEALARLVNLQTSLDEYLAVEKHLFCRQKIFRNTVIRGPVGYELDDETRNLVEQLFDELCEEISS